jgi:hypothetical protein
MIVTTQVPIWKKLAAGAAALVAAGALFSTARSESFVVALPLALLSLSALSVHSNRLGAQLFSRAVWWSNLGLGTALAVVGAYRESESGALMSLACGLALLVIGRRGLAEASEAGGFAPAAFRGSLLLLMVLALADAQTFLLFGVVGLNKSGYVAAWGPGLLVVGVSYAIAFVGLYRLALWGALVSVATSAVAFVALVALPIATTNIREFLTVVTGAQCLAAAPLLIGLVRRKPLPSLGQRGRSVGASVVIGLLVVFSVASCVYRR